MTNPSQTQELPLRATFAGASVWMALLLACILPFFLFNEILPSTARHVTDIFSVLMFLAMMMEIIRTNSFQFPVKYVVFAFVLMASVVVSALVNQQSIGSLFLGIKTYFVFIPYFLLPFAVAFPKEKVKKWILALLAIAVLQMPIAVYQRFVQYVGHATGDYITGTLGISSFLSIFLMCALAVLMGFYQRKRISTPVFVLLAIIFFLPTTINETKGTLIMLPLALLVPALVNSYFSGRILQMIPVLTFGAVAFVVFLSIFNQFEQANFDRSLGDRDLIEYTFTGNDFAAVTKESPVIGRRAVNETRKIGRGDSAVAAFTMLAREPTNLALGVGLGNMTETSIPFLESQFESYEHLMPGYTVLSKVLWELGLWGIVLIGVIFAMVAWDTFIIASRLDFSGAFALGWLGVVSIIAFSTTYKDLTYSAAISGLFWFWTGYVCALRVRQPNAELQD